MKQIPQSVTAKKWFEVSIPTHADRVDIVTAALAGLGITGSEVREPGPAAAEIVVYVEAEDPAAARAEADRIAAHIGSTDPGDLMVTAAVPTEVWTENWRRHFVPVRIGKRLLVVPPWETLREPGRLALVINPGSAFGTGQHETTALCLAAIDEFVAPGDRVADVGCGSGILAIAAAKLGATRVYATDIEIAAIEATRENAEANGVAGVVEATLTTPTAPCLPAAEEFDLVVANIYSDSLVALSAELSRHVAPGGHIVLSGIEAERAKIVEIAFSACGLSMVETRVEGAWAALVFGRRAA
jgi:ribosomal protein L11 methyltransferase